MWGASWTPTTYVPPYQGCCIFLNPSSLGTFSLWRARKTWCVGGILDAHHVCPSLSRLLHIFKPLITQHILVSLRSTTHTFTRSHPTSSTTWHHPLFSPSMTPYSVPHTSPLQTCLLPNPSAINPRCHHPPTQTFFRLGGVYSLTLLCQ